MTETRSPRHESPVAYSVLETEEHTGVIVFARSKDEAREVARPQLDDEDVETACRREPWADQYVGSRIPASAMVEHGWGMECQGCYVRIDSDLALADMTDRVEDGQHRPDRYLHWKPEHVVGHQTGPVHCDERCRLEENGRNEKRNRMKARAITRFSDILRTLLPQAEPVERPKEYGGQSSASYDQSNGVLLLQSVSVPFSYPGARHGYALLEYSPRDGSRSYKGIRFSCPNGDVDAFATFRASVLENA